MLRKILYGLENVVRWLPVIWNDRQWDEYYLFRIMKKKLELMEGFYVSDAPVAEGAENIANDIQRAIELLTYIMEEEYAQDAFEEYWDECLDESSNSIFYFTKEQSELFEKCNRQAEDLYEQHMTELCDLIKQKVRNWWD